MSPRAKDLFCECVTYPGTPSRKSGKRLSRKPIAAASHGIVGAFSGIE
jgi:hypothetical protein